MSESTQHKKSKQLISIVIIVFVVAAIYAAKTVFYSSKRVVQNADLARVKGDENAPVKIKEFIDFQCPACANGAKYLKKFMQEHPHDIRLELKYFPLAMHQHGFTSARYAECAAWQGKFWPFHDYLIEKQDEWKNLIDARPAFSFIAKETKLNLTELETCLQNEKVNAAIEKTKVEGQLLSVKSTPTYFVNGKMVVGTKSLEMELDSLINNAKN